MLLAVEGGGFFSSSASGYSKGLTLLLLGQKSEDKPMRVSPWNQYQLVDQESDTDFQLASGKNKISRGCASFVCFGRASAGLDGQPAFKVGPTQPHDTLPDDPVVDSDKEVVSSVDNENNVKHVSLKSSLKKLPPSVPAPIKNEDEREPLDEQSSENLDLVGRRKVQWTDACGRELAEIREFELRYGAWDLCIHRVALIISSTSSGCDP